MTRILLALWLIFGMWFSTSAIYAEILVQRALDTVNGAIARANQDQEHRRDIMKTGFITGLRSAQEAATIAPQIYYLRSRPAYFAMINPMMPDEDAIPIFEYELRYDPFNSHALALLALRYEHLGNHEKAKAYLDHIDALWGVGSKPSQAVRTLAPELR